MYQIEFRDLFFPFIMVSCSFHCVWINKNRDCLSREVRNERKEVRATLKGMFGVFSTFDSRYASFTVIHFTIDSNTLDYNNRNI